MWDWLWGKAHRTWRCRDAAQESRRDLTDFGWNRRSKPMTARGKFGDSQELWARGLIWLWEWIVLKQLHHPVERRGQECAGSCWPLGSVGWNWSWRRGDLHQVLLQRNLQARLAPPIKPFFKAWRCSILFNASIHTLHSIDKTKKGLAWLVLRSSWKLLQRL